MTQRYPLQWPVGRPRTSLMGRRAGLFRTGTTPGIALGAAIKRIQYELDRVGASNATVSTNLELRLDGASHLARPEVIGALLKETGGTA